MAIRIPKSIQTWMDESRSPSMNVERLVRKIQTEEPPYKSFRLLFELYIPSVTYFFLNRGFSRQDADDLAQKVLLRVYEKVGTFRFDASFDTWLFRIVTNTWKNALRSSCTLEGQAEKVPIDEVIDLDKAGEGRELRDLSPGPLERLLADERSHLLLTAFEELPPKMRQCMVLRVSQGLKYREIADKLGVSMTTVKTQLSEGRKRLEPLLEKNIDVFDIRGAK